ncbi:MAG: HNH endonuclease [Candidatus Rokubacteria bacterium]|nr:HNH endonuclease [Candidatus Rokubacteria bacterium]
MYQRDRFRCVFCGRSPISDLTVELHVDHVVPFVRSGETALENLQTLCSKCNLGKADRDDVRQPGV